MPDPLEVSRWCGGLTRIVQSNVSSSLAKLSDYDSERLVWEAGLAIAATTDPMILQNTLDPLQDDGSIHEYETNDEKQAASTYEELDNDDSLVSANTEILELHLAHVSVKEYLLSSSPGNIFSGSLQPSPSKDRIIEISLAYLSEASKSSEGPRKKILPFERSSASIWISHAMTANGHSALEWIHKLFSRKKFFLYWLDIYEGRPPYKSPLYYAAREGLILPIRNLLQDSSNRLLSVADFKLALIAAASRDHGEVVKSLADFRFKHQKSNQSTTEELEAVLSVAISKNSTSVVKHLVELGANLDTSTSILRATRHGYIDMVRVLLDYGASVDRPDLLEAVRGEDVRLTALLLERGVDSHGDIGYYALSRACCNNDIKMVRLLLDHGTALSPETNERREMGLSGSYFRPLSAAAYNGNTEMVRILLSKNIDINDGEPKETALFAAARNGQLEIMKLLLVNQAKLDPLALMIAATNGHIDIIALMIHYNVDIHIRHGYSPNPDNALQAAAAAGQLEAVKLLISRGANVDEPTLAFAASGGHTETLRLLLDYAATISSKVLYTTICEGELPALKLLYGYEAKIAADYSNAKALRIAAAGGYPEVVAFLLQGSVNVNALSHQFRFRYEVYRRPVSGDREFFYDFDQWDWRPAFSLYHDAGANPVDSIVDFQHTTAIRTSIDLDGVTSVYSNYLYDMLEDVDTALQATVANSRDENHAFGVLHSKAVENGEDRSIYGFPVYRCGKRYLETAEVLLKAAKGIDVDVVGVNGNALQIASQHQNEKMVKMLLHHGADANMVGPHGTALQLAIKGIQYESITGTIEQLAASGANIDAPGSHGTALEMSIRQGLRAAVKILVSKGADVNRQGSFGTPLQIAAKKGLLNIMEYLISAGVDIDHAGPLGTPLQIALAHQHKNLVLLLLSEKFYRYQDYPRNARWPRDVQQTRLTMSRTGGHYLPNDEMGDSGASFIIKRLHQDRNRWLQERKRSLKDKDSYLYWAYLDMNARRDAQNAEIERRARLHYAINEETVQRHSLPTTSADSECVSEGKSSETDSLASDIDDCGSESDSDTEKSRAVQRGTRLPAATYNPVMFETEESDRFSGPLGCIGSVRRQPRYHAKRYNRGERSASFTGWPAPMELQRLRQLRSFQKQDRLDARATIHSRRASV